MTINRSTLLDLPLPVTGTEAGTWGDITNNGLTNYLDIAIAGMNSLTSSDFTTGALTIALTEGDASATNIAAGTAQYATIKVSSLAQNSTITAPASARSYRIINADATYNLTIKASGQTGVTFLPGTTGLVAFNGTDYEIVGVVGPASATDNAVVRFDSTTGQVIQNSGVTIDDSNNVSGVAQLNATTADLTNIEVTNIKAKDGTASATIADSTGVMTIATLVGTNDATVNGLTVGRGAGAVSTNTAVGASALAANTTGNGQIAIGTQALRDNTTGTGNTAVGYQSMIVGNGSYNISLGGLALNNLSSGSNNVGVGYQSLQANTTASYNTAVGYQAGYSITTGSRNVSIGYRAGYVSNPSGGANVFVGASAGTATTSGITNTYIGTGAGNAATTASRNTFIGDSVGYNLTTGSTNTFIGLSATNASGADMTTGSKNTILGGFTGNQGGLDIRTSDNYIVLSDGDGNPLVSTADNQTVALEGAVPNSGTGITFPATQSASTNANTLDDYEEGTFTPVVDASGVSGVTYAARVGKYTKIGNRVTADVDIELSSKGTGGSGNVQVTGLPFAASSTAGYYINYGCLIDYLNSDCRQVSVQTIPAQSYVIGIKNGGSTSGHSGLQYSDITNITTIRFSASYEVA